MAIRTVAELEALVQRDPSALITPGEAAAILRVDPKTVTRWAIAGRVRYARTPGGHRRLSAAQILAAALPQEQEIPA